MMNFLTFPAEYLRIPILRSLPHRTTDSDQRFPLGVERNLSRTTLHQQQQQQTSVCLSKVSSLKSL
jgi:hypothetical protein